MCTHDAFHLLCCCYFEVNDNEELLDSHNLESTEEGLLKITKND